MTSTTTLDEVIVHLFGEEYLQAFNQIDIVTTSSDEEVQTIDELASAYLGKEVTSALPKVDLKEELAGMEITLREFHIRVRLQGLSLIFSIIILAGLVLGSRVAISMLQTVFS